jgi:hypothetical protein
VVSFFFGIIPFRRSSAGLSLIPEDLGLSFSIFAFSLGLVGYGDFNLCEQRIVFFSDQAGSFVHAFLRARSALRLELCPAPLYDRDNIVRVHGTYFAFFRFTGAEASSAFILPQRAAAAFLAISERCSGVSFFIRASPLNFPPLAPWRLK